LDEMASLVSLLGLVQVLEAVAQSAVQVAQWVLEQRAIWSLPLEDQWE